MRSFLCELPEEISIIVFSYVSFPSIFMLMMANKRIRRICKDRVVTKSIYSQQHYTMFDFDDDVKSTIAKVFCGKYRDMYDYNADNKKWLKYVGNRWIITQEIMIKRAFIKHLLPRYIAIKNRLDNVRKRSDDYSMTELRIVMPLFRSCIDIIKYLKNPRRHNGILKICKTIYQDRIDFLE